MISGGVLPIVALGFIKSLVDYLKPTEDVAEVIEESTENKNSVITIDSEGVDEIPSEKFDSTIDIKDELITVTEDVKEPPVKPTTMPRTPGQYNGHRDPIIGTGSLRKK
jgi:hypothetical protein